MADTNIDPFADINADENPDASLPQKFKGLTPDDRLILNNIFDSQPKRREAYAKKLGITLDPEDDNKFKVLGSKGPYDGEIAPGWHSHFDKGGLAEVAKVQLGDMWNKIKDLGFSAVVNAPLIALGAKAGAAIGAQPGIMFAPETAGLSIPAGATAGGLIGAVLGGALGNAASEGIKEVVGDWLLEQDYVPPDQVLKTTQSIFMGIAPLILTGGAKLTKDAIKGAWSIRTDAVKHLIRVAGGVPDDHLLEMAAQKPWMFTKERVQGASQALHDTYRSIFGMDPEKLLKRNDTEYIPPTSLLYKPLEPLVETQKTQYAILDGKKQANWTTSELVSSLKQQLDKLPQLQSERDVNQKAFATYAQDKIKEIYGDAAKISGQSLKGINDIKKMSFLDDIQLPYSKGRNILNSMQNDARNVEVPGYQYLSKAISSQTEGQGLGAVADQKAAAVYRDFLPSVPPEEQVQNVNKKISQIKKVYALAGDALSPDNIGKAFIGRGANPNSSASVANVRNALKQVGDVTGDPNLGTDVGMQAVQAWAENAYANPRTVGSSRTLPAMAMGAIEGGTKGAVVGGAMTGGNKTGVIAGGIGGALHGAAKGASMSSPETALAALGKAMQSEQTVNKYANMIPSEQAILNNAVPKDLSEAINQYSDAGLQAIYASPLANIIQTKEAPTVSPSLDAALSAGKSMLGIEETKKPEEQDPFADITF